MVPGTPALEGLFHRGFRRTGVVILPAEPDRGGMESPVVAEIAWAVTRRGHPSLRINYPGVGASEGVYGLESARTAADRATEHLLACLEPEQAVRPDAIGFVGLGRGAQWAVELAHARQGANVFLVQPKFNMSRVLAPPRSQGVVVSASMDPPEDVKAREEWASKAAGMRAMVVPEADSSWRRHLMVVGQAAADLFSPPGEIDFGD